MNSIWSKIKLAISSLPLLLCVVEFVLENHREYLREIGELQRQKMDGFMTLVAIVVFCFLIIPFIIFLIGFFAKKLVLYKIAIGFYIFYALFWLPLFFSMEIVFMIPSLYLWLLIFLCFKSHEELNQWKLGQAEAAVKSPE